VVLLLSASANAQENEKKEVKKISVRDFYVQYGFSHHFHDNGYLADFRTLAPNSAFLQQDFTGYSVNTGFSTEGLHIRTDHILCSMVGIKFRDKEKTGFLANPELGVGLDYFSGSILRGTLYKQDHFNIDTLTTPQGYTINNADSMITNGYEMRYYTGQLLLDIDLIYRTNPDARYSLYAGAGITSGFSIMAHTDIQKFKSNFIENSTHSSVISASSEMHIEKNRNKTNFGFSAYIPVGFDLRVGRKSKFLEHLHIYYELRSTIYTVMIPELRIVTQASLQHFIGIRISRN
jgi:hypothetical protein